jgi:hypothetical protein
MCVLYSNIPLYCNSTCLLLWKSIETNARNFVCYTNFISSLDLQQQTHWFKTGAVKQEWAISGGTLSILWQQMLDLK